MLRNNAEGAGFVDLLSLDRTKAATTTETINAGPMPGSGGCTFRRTNNQGTNSTLSHA